MSLEFMPLYWVYHDFWKYQSLTHQYTRDGVKTTENIFDHYGHMHFFIPGFYTQQANTQQAYSGTQVYNFNLIDLWSPNSNDINQQNNIRIIGKPKWYFYIEQYWRRIYIQDWDYKDNSNRPGFLGKKGIKYDASLPQHTKGIYRQTKDNYFFYTDLCRTLPIQYWKNQSKTVRDHYLRMNNRTNQYRMFYEQLGLGSDGSNAWYKTLENISVPTWDFSNDYPTLKDPSIVPTANDDDNLIEYTDFYTHFDEFTIPRKSMVDSIANYNIAEFNKETGKLNKQLYKRAYGDESGARLSAHPDRYYIHPIIEYQKVIHKNWQRMDGWEQRDVQSEQTGQQFGDSYNYTITIPFTRNINGQEHIQSPFSDDNGKVYPAGMYMHNVVPQSNKLKYNLTKGKNGNPLFNNYEMQFYYKKPRDTWHYPMIDQIGTYDGKNDILFTNWAGPSYYENYLDGMWVQQCLGAIVKAKVKVITQDNYGGRTTNWVETTAFQLDQEFVGKDQ